MRRLFIFAMAGLLAACAQQVPVKLYSGNELPPAQVVRVELPQTLEVLNINGQPAPAANRMLGNGNRELHLQPGEYRINTYYKNGFDIDGGLSHEVVRSKSTTFHVKGQAGDLWKLEFDEPENLAQARELKNRFIGWASNTRTGERVPSEAGAAQVSLLTQLLGAGGGMPIADDAAVAPLEELRPAPRVAPTASSAEVASRTLPHDEAVLTTLQQIWLLLGEDSRKTFLEWASQ
ncbi:DUF2057 family protein [Stutzerimonas kirkiae]|uniref:DUF2057 domain-containing protein n=1 Tax=Stutzerimonas kirkiae TaxID=2211392 RepID=A0A4Q9REJ3_9GAMM|nr:DUF2057 family protein [Stutzerimonas kirkiae]TBU98590.1 hypothetical protein DNJ96_04955 [Stutzerimonas kirkiae]TBV04236.1 hypothetical protein DNJ95_05455 [Stutzerimonas kirkiae]TBV10940.1 hypothetical protein DNK08_04895 [Stutzerimonas kirkiae]